MKTSTDEQLVNKWKQTGFYDFDLLSPQEQIDLSAHLEEIISSLSSKPNDVILETLRERCLTWVHRNKITLGIKMNEVDRMIKARGWICDWDVSTAERVEKLIIEQMNLVHELSMENEEHRKVFAEIFLALGTDETDRTKWAGMIREMKKESK